MIGGKKKLFDRAWKISVIPRSKRSDTNKYGENDAIVVSSSDYGDEALKCMFNVTSALAAYSYGDVSVYNMNHKTIQMLASEGGRVAIEAGYKDNRGLIWQGFIWHAYDVRENVVDRVFTMHCVDSIAVVQTSFVSATLSTPVNCGDKIEYVSQQMKLPWKTSDSLKSDDSTLTRGSVFFRDGRSIIKEEAQVRGLQVGTNQDGEMTTTDLIQDVSPDSDIVISPDSGLIGTPTQIPKGISFQTLLDPRIRFKIPAIRVNIRHGEIKSMPVMYGQHMQLLEPSGTYKVVYVNHVGDTRGNTWHTNVQGVVNPDMIAGMGGAGAKPTANLR